MGGVLARTEDPVLKKFMSDLSVVSGSIWRNGGKAGTGSSMEKAWAHVELTMP